MASLPLRTSLVLGLLLRLVGADFISGLQTLCGDMMARPVAYKVQLICEDISSFLEQLNRENELESYGWLPSIRNSRDTSSAESALKSQDMAVGLRTRRGGNYIRFGRSVPSYSQSFGQRDTRGDGHYVRFGRSLPDVPADQSLLHEMGKSVGHSNNFDDVEDKEKRFMRFGRDPGADVNMNKVDEKRFMRFGKKDSALGNGNKRFMRFGKREDEGDATIEEEKRFMRFGRRDDEMEPEEEKRFMRFGKRYRGSDDLGKLDYETSGKRFMRFGKRTQEDIDEKRFMRFGKREDDEDEKSEDKRFMRFGKRFMRFGRIPSNSQNTPIEPKDISDDKRFMRFGKRGKLDDLDTVLDSSLLNEDNIKGSDDKRFMRFGKKSDGINDKRFMRFGKRSNGST